LEAPKTFALSKKLWSGYVTGTNTGADPVSKVRGKDSSNIWWSSLITGSIMQERNYRPTAHCTTLQWQNNERKKRLISRMLYSELYEIMV